MNSHTIPLIIFSPIYSLFHFNCRRFIHLIILTPNCCGPSPFTHIPLHLFLYSYSQRISSFPFYLPFSPLLCIALCTKQQIPFKLFQRKVCPGNRSTCDGIRIRCRFVLNPFLSHPQPILPFLTIGSYIRPSIVYFPRPLYSIHIFDDHNCFRGTRRDFVDQLPARPASHNMPPILNPQGSSARHGITFC